MKRTSCLGVLLLCLSAGLPAVYGQGVCTLNNIAGTYAFNFTGASTIATGIAEDTFHWNALYAPIAGVGILTIKPNGTASGKYWMVAGAWNFGLDAIPLESTVTLSPDCTGTFELPFQGTTLKERFVVLGNGREIRAVATQTAVETGNWLTSMHRIGGSCGQNKVRGDYLFECKSLFEFPPPAPIFGAAFHIRMLIAQGGNYTATLYGKVGPDNTPLPAYGQIKVNNDCTAEGTFASDYLPTVNHAKGVFFDEGRQGYWLPLVMTLPDGSTRPQPYGYCLITQIDKK